MNTDACTMPTAERPLRLAEFDSLFATAVRVALQHHAVARGEGLVERVRDLAERETRCCSFFTFVLAGTDAEVTLDVSVPAARQEILDGLAARAAELSA